MQRQMPPEDELYQALVARDASYEGVFVVGVTSTGILCRPTCPARKPHPQNVEYFRTVREALMAGYRPCKRCQPLKPLGSTPAWMTNVLDEVESDPGRRWKDADIRVSGVDPARLRRWFKAHHGMTFQGYLRLRRLGMALGRMQSGEPESQVAYDHGYESLSGFREAMQKLTGRPAGKSGAVTLVHLSRFTTPLGPVLAGTTDQGVCLLEFVDRRMLETQLAAVERRLTARFVPGRTDLTDRLEEQLEAYFKGRRTAFDVPLHMAGTAFQEAVWQGLMTIPYGKTRSYAEQAAAIGRPTAVRAVARANGDNRLSILIPCHRVVGSDGSLTGYGGGLWRKRALLGLEQGADSPAPRQPDLFSTS
ncbi:MAG: methylated-DNA--[protein]-cysteine S-methyltransferase [Rhodothermales bacterium]